MFIITDGSKYLHRTRKGKYELGAKSLAERYETETKADNVLNSSLSKVLRARCYVVLDAKTEDKKINPEIIEMVEADELKEWTEQITLFQNFTDQIECKMIELQKEESNIDLEICDINHYIEFKNLNAYQGWIAYKMLQIRLRQRRKIKNKISVLQSLSNSKISSSCLNNVLNKICNINSLTYEPRKLSVLFDGEREVHYEL